MRSKNNTTLSTTNVLHGSGFVGTTMIIILYDKFSPRLNSEGPRCRAVTRRIILLSSCRAFFFLASVHASIVKYKLQSVGKKNFFFALLILFMYTFMVSRFVVHALFTLCINNYCSGE